MSVTIRPIHSEEIGSLQKFIHEHWKPDHAFVRSTELLRWQHAENPFKAGSPYAEDELTFLGAFDAGALIAVLGEIPLSFTRFGRTVPGTWLALWKNREESRHASAGIQLLQRILSGPAVFVGGIGMHERVRRIYQLFRFRIGEDLPLFAVLNPGVESRLVVRKPGYTPGRAVRLHPRPSAAESHDPPADRVPPAPAAWESFWSRQRTEFFGVDRTAAYMRWRYLDHPHYRYEWLSIDDARGDLGAVAITRSEEAEGERILHVVEFLGEGEPCERLARALCASMRETRASFLGFRCARTRSFDAWRDVGGGVYERGDPDFEIPSLFQPVVPEYRPLVWCYRFGAGAEAVDETDFYVTRSDGDQDRPSRID